MDGGLVYEANLLPALFPDELGIQILLQCSDVTMISK